jgi:hypothetical protein
MKAPILLLAAGAMALVPAFASATPGHSPQPQTSTTQNGPTTTGQPDQDCEDLVASGEGATPGQSTNAPGSAFNPAGVAGSVYAGEQPQNSRNTASVSQYDVACANQPQ